MVVTSNVKSRSCFVAANWAQLAGEREQNNATPYVPDQLHRNRDTSIRPMWSARWGHAVVVLDESLPDIEAADQLRVVNPVLVLLGGDDGLPRELFNFSTSYGELDVIYFNAATLVDELTS
jgi:hypothetical protein